jgi:uncharacterized membrane protein YbhN (UPF0104 family)
VSEQLHSESARIRPLAATALRRWWRHRHVRTALITGAVIGVLGILVHRFEDLLEALSGTEPDLGYVPVMIALATLYYFLKALRWHFYLRVSKVRLSWWRSCAAYLAGQWFTFTPAGELVRSYLLFERYRIPFERSAPTVVLQALMDFASLALMAILAAVWVPVLLPVVLPVAMPVLAFMLALLFPLPRRWLRSAPVLHRLPLIRSRRFQALLDHADTLLAVRPTLVGLGMGLPAVAVGAGTLVAAGMALHVEGWHLVPALLVYSIAQLLGGVSIFPQGLGVTEASGTALLALLEVPALQAASAVILFRVCTLGWSILLGGCALVVLRLDRGRDCADVTAGGEL